MAATPWYFVAVLLTILTSSQVPFSNPNSPIPSVLLLLIMIESRFVSCIFRHSLNS